MEKGDLEEVDVKIEHVQIPWNKDLRCVLLLLVLKKGAHINMGSHGITDIWKEINDEFFNSPITIQLRATHYDKEKGQRKLREQFNNIMSKFNKDKQDGKSNGTDASLVEYYNLVNQIQKEITESELNKKENKKRKVVLIETAHGDLKNSKETDDSFTANINNGEINVDKGTNHNNSNSSNNSNNNNNIPEVFSVEHALINLISTRLPPITSNKPSEVMVCNEELIEIKMMHKYKNVEMKEFVTLAGINDKLEYYLVDYNILESLTVEVLISIYCSRGENFNAKYFKQELSKYYFSFNVFLFIIKCMISVLYI